MSHCYPANSSWARFFAGRIFFLLAVVIATAMPGAASAGIVYWTGNSSLSWVTAANWNTAQDGMWGTVVEITHRGDLVSVYCGLDPNVMVKAGMAVNAKQVIGVLGTGNLAEMSMESHLHFAVKQSGKFIDPLSLMDDNSQD